MKVLFDSEKNWDTIETTPPPVEFPEDKEYQKFSVGDLLAKED